VDRPDSQAFLELLAGPDRLAFRDRKEYLDSQDPSGQSVNLEQSSVVLMG